MPSFKIKVVTHTRKVIDQEADYLRVRTTTGDLGILANHAPLVAELSMGQMEIVNPDKNNRDSYFVSGGFLEISNNEVTIIADDILSLDEIDIDKEEEEINKMKTFIAKDEKNSSIFERKIKEAQAKIEMKKIYAK